MKIRWHCRGCNETGEDNIDWRDVIKNREYNKNVLEIIQNLIKHDCKDKDIGIRTI